MTHKVLLLLLVFFFCSCTAGNENVDGKLAKPIGSALFALKLPTQRQPAALLLGTSHTSPKGMVFPKEFVFEYMSKIDTLYLEGKPSTVADVSRYTLPNEMSIFDVSPVERHEEIRALIDALRTLNVDKGHPLEFMHPGLYAIYWSWMLPARGQQSEGKSQKGDDGGIDWLLESRAVRNKTQIKYLESADSRLAALTSHPIPESLACLNGFIRVLEDKAIRDQIRAQPSVKLLAFNRGDIEASIKENQEVYDQILGCPKGVFEREFTIRNKHMVRTIIESLKSGESAVFAPGFAHLGGAFGIVRMLQEQGVEVVRLTP
jgi:uncharacterized protein YbaP (TraB family)